MPCWTRYPLRLVYHYSDSHACYQDVSHQGHNTTLCKGFVKVMYAEFMHCLHKVAQTPNHASGHVTCNSVLK